MPNHPNRSRRKNATGRNPKPAEIRKAREKAGLSPKEAAAIIYASERAWIKWERGERKMHAAFWELFNLKVQKRTAARSP